MVMATLTAEEWIELAPAFAAAFPEGRLSVDGRQQVGAAHLLDEVRDELRPMGEDILQYFDGSRPRYELALALALKRLPGSVLDLGCSPGHLGMALSRARADVTGLDLSDAWRGKYPPGWADRLKVRCADLEREALPFRDESFDVVMFTEVLEHIAIKDPAEVLGEIRRVLRTGGQLILSTPNVANVGNILALARGENIFWPSPIFYGSLDRHNREYTPTEVRDLLVRSGFETFELGYMNTWSNWHHVTGPDFHHLHDGSPRARRLTAHPLFNNTIFAAATRTR